MKIRNSFVANSSSTSFIVPIGGKVKNVFDLAKMMINLRIEDYDEDKITPWPENKKLIKLIKESKKDKNTPVIFPTCNYDTLISKRDNDLVVNTSWNHDWSDVPKSFENENEIEVLNKSDEEFWHLGLNKMVKFLKDSHMCYQKTNDYTCYGMLYQYKNKVICDKCKKIQELDLPRKEQ